MDIETINKAARLNAELYEIKEFHCVVASHSEARLGKPRIGFYNGEAFERRISISLDTVLAMLSAEIDKVASELESLGVTGVAR